LIKEILKWWPAFAAFLVAYIVVIIASGAGWNPAHVHWNFQNPGAFGDSFGPLSTAIALVAAIGAVAAYQAQREELDHIKASAPLERAEAAKRDFEITFFNLLGLLRETVKEVDVTDQYNKDPLHGRDALKRILEEKIGASGGNDEYDITKFRNSYFIYRDHLAHYFRLVYHILKYVKNTADIDKMLYVRLLRATLSNAEIVLIALNCMYGGGKEKLKPLVEEFSLLHNISASDAKSRRIINAFDPSAFGDRSFSESDDRFED
jgi:hypothetical protein